MQRMLKWTILGGAVAVMAAGCGKRPEEQACEDPPKQAEEKTETVSEKAVVSQPGGQQPADWKNVFWCRACVVGPAGYMSCQTVRRENGQTDDALREKARIAACTDAGFSADKCPAANVISLLCKDDPPPKDKTAAGKAMLDALRGSGPVVLTKDGKTVPNVMHDAPASGPGAPAPEKKSDSSGAGKPSDATGAPHVE